MLVMNKFHKVGATAKLFDGLGKIPGQYELKLRSDSEPFAITAPRRVSILLLETVRNELEQMKDLGGIRKVEKAGIVVVAKSKGVHEEGDKMQKRRYISAWN